MSSHENIFHMNPDCIYHPKSIERKISFMKRTGAECIYCDTTLCYDIYGKELYKTESSSKIYESTLYHTREFWKRRGFQWADTEYEGKYFHYNNGVDRKMDNYYDTIQLLSVHNINQYKPVKVTIEGIQITIPEIISDIKIEEHPFKKYILDFFPNEVSILGLESEFLMNVKNEQWTTHNITGKWKQTKLVKQIREVNDSFNILFYCGKNPAWDLFKHIPFDIIILETPKNYEQMTSIILTNNIRDLENDYTHNKITLAVKLGEKKSRILYILTIFLISLLLLISSMENFNNIILSFFVWFTFPISDFGIKRFSFKINFSRFGRDLNHTLYRTAMSHLLLCISLAISITYPSVIVASLFLVIINLSYITINKFRQWKN